MTDQKVDRRVQRTRQLLRDALIALILEKGYDKITVQNIVDQANVGRSTFYSHFLDKDDLMESLVEELREELHQHMVKADADERSEAYLASLTLFRHMQQQHYLYKAMIGGQGIDIVEKAIKDTLMGHAQTYFEQIQHEGVRLTVPMPVLTTFLASSLLTLLMWWLDNDMPYPAEQMNDMFIELVRDGIEAVVVDR